MTPDGAVEPAPVIQPAPSLEQRRPPLVSLPVPPPGSRPTSPDPGREPAAFLREVGIPEMLRAGRRLEAVDHQLLIQDLLDLPEAALRILLWPRPGPMVAFPERRRATLEISLCRDEPEAVAARYWTADRSWEPIALGRTPPSSLDLAWVRSRVLEFIADILDRA
ncbi:MAG: hypothetical protein FIA95_09360 [Gemmatimonadetes bacterium]|nr:hypothetical protein [Gemmatimonadota bacterium]